MKLLRSFPFLAFLLVLLSIVALCVAQQSVGLLLVAGALATVSWYFTEGPRGRSLPRWVANLLVVTAAMFLALELFQPGVDVPSALGQFALWLILIKLYERRTAKDYGQLLALSLLLVLIGCLLSTDFFFGLVLLAYIGIGVYVLLLHQLHLAHAEARAARAKSMNRDETPLPVLQPIIGRYVIRDFRLLIGGVAIAGFLIASVVFVLFPRGTGDQRFADIGRTAPETTGFTREVNLVDGGRITTSRRAVMSVQVRDATGEPYRAADPLRLRGATLDRYEGEGKWRQSDSPSARFRLREGEWTPFLAEEKLIRPNSIDVRMVHATDVVFAPDPPIAIMTQPTTTILLDRHDLTIRPADDEPALTAYRVRMDAAPTDELLSELHRLRQPRGRSVTMNRLLHPDIRALAERLLREHDLPVRAEDVAEGEAYWRWSREAANVFMRYLHGPDFQYTLDLSDVTFPVRENQTVDPVKYFLLELRRGHCEYFAAAFIALCRNVGLESRMVSGYLAASYDQAAQQYSVQERHAHAWAEVRTSPFRWSQFDPTPPTFIHSFHQDDAGLADRMRWFYDRMDGLWGRTIVSYDAQAQTHMASRLEPDFRQRLQNAMQQVRQWIEELNRAFYFGPAGYIWLGLIGAILIFASLVFAQFLRRFRRLRRAAHLERAALRDSPRLLHQLGFYLDMLEVLRRAGLEKPAAQTPLIFAEQLHETAPNAAAHVRGLVEHFYDVRYGGRDLTETEIQEQQRHVRDLARALHVRA